MIKYVNNDLAYREHPHSDDTANHGLVDIHCHCLPMLDDGPASVAESIALCNKLSDDGIATVVATPHQLGRYTGRNHPELIRKTAEKMNEQLENSRQPLKILPGAEVRLDERICRFLANDKILTLGDNGKHILLELPQEIFINIEPLFAELASLGIQTVIAHAERITALTTHPGILRRWAEKSVSLQITASSLIGKFGRDIERTSWDLFFSGLVALVASDAHDVELRAPCMRKAFDCIKHYVGEECARRVCIENPLRIISGMKIEPVGAYDRLEAKR
ncbi:MAG: hypothetical protein P8016_08810 [Sedimentisphaerales bacterium]